MCCNACARGTQSKQRHPRLQRRQARLQSLRMLQRPCLGSASSQQQLLQPLQPLRLLHLHQPLRTRTSMYKYPSRSSHALICVNVCCVSTTQSPCACEWADACVRTQVCTEHVSDLCVCVCVCACQSGCLRSTSWVGV